jgi:WD40 repeat protein
MNQTELSLFGTFIFWSVRNLSFILRFVYAVLMWIGIDGKNYQSDVLSVTFSPFHSNLIFGGTYSGQILLWDTRSKHLPVLKTPLSAAGHTHPVYAMQMVGTQNAHNLITSSTDGTVCSWLVDMLAQPQVSIYA